jgi:hypothetical protein
MNQPWCSNNNASYALRVLRTAKETRRPLVLLLGAGASVDSGFPLAAQMKEYLVQVNELALLRGHTNVQQFISETRWPSRHDLRLDLMIELKSHAGLDASMPDFERRAMQAALVSELRFASPSMAHSLAEIFQLNDPRHYRAKELDALYGSLRPLAQALARRSPQNVAYRSLLFHMADGNQTTIDQCFDHFVRDRQPTTMHQFIYFLCKSMRSKVVLTTNFDPLLELAFQGEGLSPRVYELQGNGNLPSPQLLLSQPMSVVKLHGGAHQLNTGFDLDAPLPPATSLSFERFYKHLEQDAEGRAPLTLVIGYSGSDRRVMDIVSSQVRGWSGRGKANREDQHPRVLWVSRDDWVPALLDEAVKLHPQVAQRGPTFVGKPQDYPAHLVRYRDGRLFLLEALQAIDHQFPIAKSNYQAVNFVPHSVLGADRSDVTAKANDDTWRIALIRSASQGGSSSFLVTLADELERTRGLKAIWIDLTEVSGVSALLDLISERVTKLDYRLQPIRRPLLLQSLVGSLAPFDSLRPTHDDYSEMHELRIAVQWVRHAMRRGRYILALDSMDEFPSSHPSLDMPSDPQASSLLESTASEHFRLRQRELLAKFIRLLMQEPELLGDSRIALALSIPKESPCSVYLDLSRHFDDHSSHSSFVATFAPTQASSASTVRNNSFHERVKQLLTENATQDRCMDLPTDDPIERGISLATSALLVSCACRRIRSEVLLVRSLSGFLHIGCQGASPAPAAKSGFHSVWSLATNVSKQSNLPSTDLVSDEELRAITRAISGFENSDSLKITTESALTEDGRRFLYRTEGGYHWMHRDERNKLYGLALDSGNGYAQVAAAHHCIALFCFDSLYEQSRDARAFLEYMFHRIATIRLARLAGEFDASLSWAARLLVALQREKHALLTRARMTVLVRQLSQFVGELEELVQTSKRGERKVHDLLHDVLAFASDLLIASGHPHTAVKVCDRRLEHLDPTKTSKLASAERILSGYTTDSVSSLYSNAQDKREVALRHFTACRDLADALVNPLLADNPFPTLSLSTDQPVADTHKVGLKFEVSGARDWHRADTFSDFAKRDRTSRLDESARYYVKVAGLMEAYNRNITSAHAKTAQRDVFVELYSSLKRRILEHELLRHPSVWIGSSRVYLAALRDSPLLADQTRRRLAAWIAREGNASSRLQGNPRSAVALEVNRLAAQYSDDPLRRSSAQQLRQECHRLCSAARLDAALHMTTKLDTGADIQETDIDRWKRIRAKLADAEAILARDTSPADRQSMAITRLTLSELLVRRAEYFWPSEVDIKKAKRNPQCIQNRRMEARAMLDEASGLLNSVESLMNEGRGENRWRFFYLHTLSRCHLLRSLLQSDHASRMSAFDNMLWSARYMVGAMSNCGLWTDRRDVLLWWWEMWGVMARVLHDNDVEKFSAYSNTMRRKLGIRWASEDAARRTDRDGKRR